MHIGFITPESPYDPKRGGGIAAYLRALIPSLLEAGHRVTIIANSQAPATQGLYGKQLRLVHIRLPNLHWYLSKLRPSARSAVLPIRQIEWSLRFYQVAKYIFEYDPVDVLESTETGSLLLANVPIAPLIIRLHGSDFVFRKYTGERMLLGSRINSYIEQYTLRHAHLLSAPSQFQAREMALLLGYTNKPIEVVPNPLFAELAQAAMVRKVNKIDAIRPSILYTGRIAPVKGSIVLFAAIKKLQGILPNMHFILAGPWQMVESPEDMGIMGDSSANTSSVALLGHVEWPKLIDLYRNSNIFVMPSLYETFGISCIEAMAFGLPVIATTAGALAELVDDGVTGLCVPPNDALALAEAVLQLVRDPSLRQRLGSIARTRVLNMYTPARIAAQNITLYYKARNTFKNK